MPLATEMTDMHNCLNRRELQSTMGRIDVGFDLAQFAAGVIVQ